MNLEFLSILQMGNDFLTMGLMIGAIVILFYFLIIRPQNKKQKETKRMLEAIKKGDKVVSIGGIHGSVFQVKDSTVILKVDDNTKMEFTKNAISSVVNATVTSDKKEEVKDESEKES